MQPSISASPDSENLGRIRQLSVFLARVCLAVAVALPLTVLAYWFIATGDDLALRGNLRPGAIQGQLLLWQRLAGALATLIPAGLVSLGLWHACQCFRSFAQGEVFTAGAVLRLRKFAGCMGASTAAAIVAAPALSVLLTWGNAAGMRQLVVSIGSNHVFTLFFAAMVWLMAAVIGQGQALADENASFV